MKKYIVYKHTCINSKVYIGITCQKAERRWNNGNGYKNNLHFYNAIKKYGWKNIKHEILYTGLTKEQACEIEIKLIEKYKSNDRKYGYNNSKGGDSGTNGFNHTKEAREKISKNNSKYWKGKRLSEETKKKISEANKNKFVGEKNPFYGKHHTKESIEKNRKAHIGKEPWNKGTKGIMKKNKGSFKKGDVSPNRKKVLCIETKIEYESISKASAETGINKTCIVNVCKGKQKIAGGYQWKYVV